MELVGPGTGETAEGELGVGRMAEPDEIAAAIAARLAAGRSMAGLRVLVTAGGTREPLDAVRYIGNRSSGRMGAAVADEAARRGADVTLILAAATARPSAPMRVVHVETAAELERATLAAAGRSRRHRHGRGGLRLPPGRRRRRASGPSPVMRGT